MRTTPYRLLRSMDGQWYWRLVAANGRTLAHSETYTTRAMAIRGIRAAVAATTQGLDVDTDALARRLILDET